MIGGQRDSCGSGFWGYCLAEQAWWFPPPPTLPSLTRTLLCAFVPVDWVADRVNPAKNVQLARDSLKAALSKARDMADPEKAVAYATDAWTTFSNVPAGAPWRRWGGVVVQVCLGGCLGPSV